MEEQAVSLPLPGFAIFFIAVALCAILLAIGAKAGAYCGLVDKPDHRKRHTGDIPLVGGLSIFLTYTALHLNYAHSSVVILAGGLLLLIGMADDYHDLKPTFRLLFQVIAASMLVIIGEHQIVSLGALVNSTPLVLTGTFSVAFSIICVVGVINATNMIDGVDGLAGGIITISLTALLLLAYIAGGSSPLIAGLLAIIGATGTFLLFNLGLFGERRRIFLGDSGTMFLGIVLASYYIGFSQGPDPYIKPVVAGWIFGLPLLDSVAVMVSRLMRRQSPLRGGRDHLHHQLIDHGIAEKTSVLIMLSIHFTLVGIGVLGNMINLPAAAMFWAFVLVVAAHYFMTPRLIKAGTTGT